MQSDTAGLSASVFLPVLGSAALAAAIKSGSAAGPFCGRGFGPPELGEAVKAKPL